MHQKSHRQHFSALWYTLKECLDKLEVAQPKLQVQILEENQKCFPRGISLSSYVK